MPRFSSNDMVHNYYLDEARKMTHEKGRNSEPSVMPSAKSQCTANSSLPKPRINNQKSRNCHASKTSCVTTKHAPIAEHSRNSRNFSDSKYFVSSTCQKCVFNANHDHCVTKFLNEVNSRAKGEQNLDLSVGTPFNLKKQRIKAWSKENVISGRPRLHGITLIQEISARQSSHGIRSLLTS
ncbi:hypothetical protein Tco_0808056 [Tanacetum coccineum]